MKKCLLIEKFGKNSPIVKAVNKFKDKKELFFNMLDVMEFELIENINEKTNNKEYSLIDLQGANLGDIESERFSCYGDILERLEIYEEDYFIRSLEDYFDLEYSSWEDLLIKIGKEEVPEDRYWDIAAVALCIFGF